MRRAWPNLARRIAPRVAVAIVLFAPAPPSAEVDPAAEPLRVCADPDNLPFSNQHLEGFENKIAAIIARDLGTTVEYYWWPHQRGLVRNTLAAGKCDVLIGIPSGFEQVLATRPYYRSAYVIASPKAERTRIDSLDAPGLRTAKIGVHSGTPPENALAERGIRDNVVTYRLFYDSRTADPERRPSRIIDDLRSGAIDVALVWGPIAGYFGTRAGEPALELVPLTGGDPIPMSFEVSMGVRKDNPSLKQRLEDALDRRQAEVQKILGDYGVPVLPLTTSRPRAESRTDRADGGGADHRRD